MVYYFSFYFITSDNYVNFILIIIIGYILAKIYLEIKHKYHILTFFKLLIDF